VNYVMFVRTYRFLIFFLFLLILDSCEKDKQAGVGPAIVLVDGPGYIANGAMVVPGTMMNFKLSMTEGSEKLTNFYIEVASGEQPVKRYFDTAMHVGELTWTGKFYKSAEAAETWTFIIRDRQGGSNSVALDILADTGSVYGPIQQLTNIVMGAQENEQYGGFYSLAGQEVYPIHSAIEKQELIDLVFYYGEDELTMASPGANIEEGIFPEQLSPVNWDHRNTTRFIKTSLTGEDFNLVTNDSIMISLYIETEGKRKAKNLAGSDVYVFRTQQNRLGLFRVNTASGTTEGTAEIDVKIQNPGK